MDCSKICSLDDLQFLFTRAESRWLDICCDLHNNEGFLLGHCFVVIFNEANHSANHVPQMLQCADILNRLTAIFCQFTYSISANRQSQILQLCLELLDFPVESIGFRAASALTNLITIHQKNCTTCLCKTQKSTGLCCNFLLTIGRHLCGFQNIQMDSKQFNLSKQRAKALQSLLRNSNSIMRIHLINDKFICSLYEQMKEAPLAIQISHLLVDDICVALHQYDVHTERLNLHMSKIKQQLISPHLQLNSHNAIEKKFLPILLRSSETKTWFLSEFNFFIDFSYSSTHTQRALCSLLQLAIQHSTDRSKSWLDFLGPRLEIAQATMQEILMAIDLQTRLSAWSLLCSHPRGAQPVTDIEICMAKQFITNNMLQRSAAIRQSIFVQLEKLLFRIREHSKSLLKMSTTQEHQRLDDEQILLYKEFFQWLHHLSFLNIAASHWHQDLLRKLTNKLEEKCEICIKEIVGENDECYWPQKQAHYQCVNKKRNDDFELEQDDSLMEEEYLAEDSYLRKKKHNDDEDDDYGNGQFESSDTEDEEGNVPFCTRITALTLISMLYKTVDVLDPFSVHIQLQSWVGPPELDKLRQALDDRFEICQDLALKLLNHFLPVNVERQQQLICISECESTCQSPLLLSCPNGIIDTSNGLSSLLFVRPHMPRHQTALEYRLRFLLPRTLWDQRCTFFIKLLQIAESSCASSDGQLFALIRPPQLHATMSALRVTLQFLTDEKTNINDFPEQFLNRLLALCHSAAELISPVVHSMSPEGFLPKEEEQLKDFIAKEDSCLYAQQLARTCFRTHREISAIFAHLIQRMMPPTNSASFLAATPSISLISTEQISNIGTYFWRQLTECRHRGAFETAAEAFHLVCKKFWEFSSEDFDNFPCNPRKWIFQILDTLAGRDVIQRFCVTRRSAGLPHLVVGILKTELPTATKAMASTYSVRSRRYQTTETNCESNSSLFDVTMLELLGCRECSEQQVDPELEVHCVNVLRLFFIDSHFSESVLPYVERTFRVVLDGCAVEHWPVRNAHTQLFAALVKRVFGTPALQQRSLHIQSRCKLSAHEFFTRNPTLYKFTFERLDQIVRALYGGKYGCRQLVAAFPLLILFTHLRPSVTDERYPLRAFLPNLLCLLLVAPARAIRELASATILSLSTQPELQRILEFLVLQTGQFPLHARPAQNFVDGIQILLSQLDELRLPKQQEQRHLEEWVRKQQQQPVEGEGAAEKIHIAMGMMMMNGGIADGEEGS